MNKRGFLWGLRVHEYSLRFSDWKKYLAGKATLSEAFTSIANKKVWIYMIIAAYFCGIGMGSLFYFLTHVVHQTMSSVYSSKFSFFTFIFWIPMCSVLLLFGANVFGRQTNERDPEIRQLVEANISRLRKRENV